MSSESQKNSTNNDDENLTSLKEWEARNPKVQYPPEFAHFCRMSEGVINRLDRPADDYSLNDESLGSGIGAMVQLAEGLIRVTVDSVRNIKIKIKTRIEKCLNCSCLRR